MPETAETRTLSAKYETYESPLVQRSGSPEMLKVWSPATKFKQWRRIWLALAESQHELGVKRITPLALDDMRAHIDLTDEQFDAAKKHEKKLRHDVMAHSKTFEEAAPAAAGVTHLAATSQTVGCNADLLIMRDGADIVIERAANLLDEAGKFAETYKDLPTLGYTHGQPAQLTTVGKRAAMWCQELVICFEDLESIKKILNRLRGLKGTTGTQSSFLELFDGDHDKVDQLEELFLRKIGGEGTDSYDAIGQVYPRSVDSQILGKLANLGSVIHKIATDIRLLARDKEIEEPFEADQIGSSAMAYKRNPMRCERACSIARLLMNYPVLALQTEAVQWFERTLDDSFGRRSYLPEAFLCADSALVIMTNVFRGLVVHPKVIENRVMAELPFIATEGILVRNTAAGGHRNDLHEKIRAHSMKAGAVVKDEGLPNDLLKRLEEDPAFAGIDIDSMKDPSKFIGRAPIQVERFLAKHIAPIRKRYAHVLGQKAELKV